MPRVTKVTYGQVKNLGNYQTERVELEAEINEDTDMGVHHAFMSLKAEAFSMLELSVDDQLRSYFNLPDAPAPRSGTGISNPAASGTGTSNPATRSRSTSIADVNAADRAVERRERRQEELRTRMDTLPSSTDIAASFVADNERERRRVEGEAREARRELGMDLEEDDFIAEPEGGQ